MSKGGKYIPALSFDWLTPLYDPLLRWGMREETFKRALIVQAQIKPGQRLLDLGCGTGTLTLLIKQLHPDSEVVGLDGDPNVLEIARGKAAQAGVTITLDHGLAFQLPYPDGSFDRVLSSLVLHHLTSEDKQRAAHEVFRVLRPGGELHVADFGQPRSAYAKLLAPVMQHLEEASDNFRGLLPEMFRGAGFAPVDEPAQFTTVFGGLSLYQARKPT
ncbi:MAG: methyltransferase domain-containing protein [Chloroflexi bacterium]|nr:methyltransferase domain-containing protein [Chloroflexota bacterium]